MANNNSWPYQSDIGKTTHMEADVLVLGGGIAGCMAAIAAAKKGPECHSRRERGDKTKRRRRLRLRPLGIRRNQPVFRCYAGRTW